jgi:two-component system LytT family response regulator
MGGAHDEYAISAFEQEALDYLLRPVTQERLSTALDRAARRFAAGAHGPEREAIARVERHMRSVPARRLLVRSGAGHRLVPVREIAQFTAEDGLARAATEATTYLTDYTLTELEARLEGAFTRVSRSNLVNIEWIDRIAGEGDGSATLTLRGGPAVHVSRRRAADVRRAIDADFRPIVRSAALSGRRSSDAQRQEV